MYKLSSIYNTSFQTLTFDNYVTETKELSQKILGMKEKSPIL